jgi:hypothetical protein
MSYPEGTSVLNSRMVIEACIPWERKGTFSAVVRPSEALKNKVVTKWKNLFPICNSAKAKHSVREKSMNNFKLEIIFLFIVLCRYAPWLLRYARVASGDKEGTMTSLRDAGLWRI